MTSVGIKGLKAQLTRYVARAAAGKETLVKDRNAPVAMVTAVDRDLRALEELRLAGRITGGTGNPRAILKMAIEAAYRGPDLAEALLEERDEWYKEKNL